MTYKPGGIDHLARLGGIDLLGDARDLPAVDRDVAHRIDAVFRIDHVPAFQQQVVARLRGRGPNQKHEECPATLIVKIVYLWGGRSRRAAVSAIWLSIRAEASHLLPRCVAIQHFTHAAQQLLLGERLPDEVGLRPQGLTTFTHVRVARHVQSFRLRAGRSQTL